MNEIQRLQQLAGLAITEAETGDEVTKTVAGHTDNEKDMIMKQLYQTGKYCVELYKMMGKMDGNTDFPHWWQGKVVKASDYIGAAKHYLENEIEAPNVEVVVTPDIEDNDPSGVI